MVLEVLEGPHAGSRFEFDCHATFLAGRSDNAHLRLPDDRYFSRHHFLLEFNPPRCYLRDLSSRNGTQVNGTKVEEVFLKDGDIIGGGRTRIRFCVERPDRQQAPVETSCLACGSKAMPDTLSSDEDSYRTHSYVCPSCQQAIQDTPQPVPGYEMVRKLGKGAMGVVHLARRKANSELVAIKLVIPDSVTSERAIDMFLREVSVLSQLDHPRIVRFHEARTAAGQFYFVMDYVETVDLIELLAALPVSKQVKVACGVLAQVLDALGYAHKKSFVHRDVKPSNILVSRTGRKLRARLSDFGLGKNLENAGFSGMTRTGAICGSLPFMPPEQVLDCRIAQPQADIYSAGATLYHLLTNAAPYAFSKGKDPYAVILDEEIVPLQEHRPQLPSGLIEIVHRALAKRPQDRFGSALEMRDALMQLTRGTALSG